ncbi:DUF4386 domain-containing protein [Agromyces protaetiae]|uniref:DUF4386 domain-containing protein n=1 Tax=Agromyces protaetiae TaxID=2509455 RepID=A0A4P6FBM4_9MICO|nr:DUF4386 domain-containing protein [Agromyces protaetiae]QAY73680.1 DUF4386 domain-containing protein [Agromyces protaetiae]
MPLHRRASIAGGVLYLLTFVSIPTFALYDAIKGDTAWVVGAGPDAPVVVGGVLELIVALACIGTGIALYPIIKLHSGSRALGFVAARTLEAAAIFAGVVALMSIVTLRQADLGQDAVVAGQSLLAQHTWTTLFGQGLIPALNAFLLGSIMFRSRLIPRALPVFGFIGAPMLVVADVGTLFGAWGPVSPVAGAAALFLSIWEFGMGAWLVVRGFNLDAIRRLTDPDHNVAPAAPVASGVEVES